MSGYLFLADTFGAQTAQAGTGNASGTALTSHTADTGATASALVNSGAQTLELDGSGGLYFASASGTGDSVYAYGATFSGAVTIAFDVHDYSDVANIFYGVGVCDGSGNGYYLQPLPSAGGWDVESFTAGTHLSTLSSQASPALSAGNTYNCTFGYSVSGGTATLTWTVKLSGSTIWSSSTTDTNYLSCNRVCIRTATGGAPTSTTSTGFHLQNLSATTAGTTFTLSGSNALYSPYTWDGSGRAVNLGAYLSSTVTLSTTSSIALNVATSLFSGAPDADKPAIEWYVDTGAMQSLQLTTSNTTGGPISLATGLASGAHTVYLRYKSNDPSVDPYTPVNCFWPLSLVTPDTGASAAAPTGHSSSIVFFGDSVTAGYGTESYGPSGWAAASDSWHSWARGVAEALQCEHAMVGWAGQGWAATDTSGQVPIFGSAWAHIDSGTARSFATPPTHIVILMGANGNTAGSAGVASGVLSAIRAAAGSTSNIFLTVPFGTEARSGLITEFGTYQGSTSSTTAGAITVYRGSADARCYLLDLGSLASLGLSSSNTSSSTASLTAYDQVHPSTARNMVLASAVVEAINLALGVQTICAGPFGGFGASLLSL